MSTILDLPLELLDRVFEYCPRQALLESRLSHRHLEQASFESFAKRFFRKKGFLITSESLGVLEAVGKHAQLRKYVQHVWFNPDCWTYLYDEDTSKTKVETQDRYPSDSGNSPHSYLDEGGPKTQTSESQGYAIYHDVRKDHVELLYNRRLQDVVLPNLFRNLPSLRVVGMRRSLDHYAWGCNKLKRLTGFRDPRILGYSDAADTEPKSLSGPTLLFRAITNALVLSEIKPIQRMYTDAIQLDEMLPRDISVPILTECNAALTSLELTIHRARFRRAWNQAPDPMSNFRVVYHPDEASDYLDEDDEASDYLNEVERQAVYGSNLVRLLNSMPHLKELSLSFRYLTDLSRHQDYNPAVLEQVSLKAAPSSLVRLKLERMDVESKSLVKFLDASSATLTSVKLRNVRLDGTFCRSWEPVFALLRDHFPRLKQLLCYRLLFRHLGRWMKRGVIMFEEREGMGPGQSAQHEGINMYSRGIHWESPLFPSMAVLECHTREEVIRRLQHVVQTHWYCHKNIEVDEDEFHTDTSDEEPDDEEDSSTEDLKRSEIEKNTIIRKG